MFNSIFSSYQNNTNDNHATFAISGRRSGNIFTMIRRKNTIQLFQKKASSIALLSYKLMYLKVDICCKIGSLI